MFQVQKDERCTEMEQVMLTGRRNVCADSQPTCDSLTGTARQNCFLKLCEFQHTGPDNAHMLLKPQ